MWSLPDIKAMNETAAAEADSMEERLAHPENHQCDICGETAVLGSPWYDIFSDDIKGINWVCEEHRGHEEDDDNEFLCDECCRRMARRYTHELYYTDIDEQRLCLKCAAEWWFGCKDHWFDPAKVKTVVLDPKMDELFNEKSGIVNFSKTKHVLGNKQPTPEGVVYYDNMEFDCENGRQISGDPPAEVFARAAKEGHKEVTVVLDTQWQFAVSIGVYVRG